MKKIFFGLGIALVILLTLGLFVISAQNSTTNTTLEQEVQETVDAVSEGELNTQVYEYVLNFVQKRGILPSEISYVREVDFESLPKEVNIENVGDHNLAIYQINYTENGVEDEIYVVSYSVEELRAQGDLIVAQDKRQFLNFGFPGAMSSSGFLETATGVEGSLEKGYVMVRDGSITAVSTNLEVIQNNLGNLDVIVYKNGQPIGFGNTLSTELPGIKKDYDVQSKGVVTFQAGDVISVYIRAQGDVVWGDVITMVEITTVS
jgi:hypothetical protein